MTHYSVLRYMLNNLSLKKKKGRNLSPAAFLGKNSTPQAISIYSFSNKIFSHSIYEFQVSSLLGSEKNHGVQK